ncbi:MAG: response regulator [Deltaproteobacteria bacterium]
MRLTEVLSISPEDETARQALAEHLSKLRRSASELGLVHLEGAVAEALSRLEQDSFGPASLVTVRMLAWRYETLAAMPSQSGTHRLVGEGPPAATVSLRGRRVLVAEDEAEVRWFYVGVLREAGARVIEAGDGVHAVELARHDVPDLVLADTAMPRLDGLGLCAALRREPALDGVPVVLVSRRVSAHELLDRVCRALEPLTRLEKLLKGDREASGDLEELGVSGLLRATRQFRRNASIVLQDPWSLFDLELHEGRVVGVTRTAIDGAVTHGAAAFPALVGMSSGRFIVAESSAPQGGEARESLDASFAHATRHLGVLLSTMAEHPDCRVEVDEDVLGTYVRHSSIGVQRMIARLVAGEPLQVLWESGAGSRDVVNAVLVTLARQGAIQDVRVPPLASDGRPAAELSTGSSGELIASEIQQDSAPVTDPIERENVRSQSAVAMHREPANQAPGWGHPIWRMNVGRGVESGENSSRFGMELQTTPRLLGLAFATLLSVTVAFLIWALVMPGGAPAGAPSAAPGLVPALAAEETPSVPALPAVPALPSGGRGLSAFAGSLRPEVDPSLEVAEGQGVLELLGPGDVGVEVDGVDRGALPATLVLDQGRHAVRYRTGARSTYRFYYVKSGATRSLNVLTQAGGLVDAR